jgi:hypothetical protein
MLPCVRHKVGNLASAFVSRWELLPKQLKDHAHLATWREAQGSIRIEEAQPLPKDSDAFTNIPNRRP